MKGSQTGVDSLSLPGRIFAQLNRLRLASSQHLRGAGTGKRASSRRRPAADFREHRKYVAGDDFRFVDWNASARSEQVFLKQGEYPQESTVHLLLDRSASMGWGEPPRRKVVLQLAAALGYLALNGDDRLHVLPLVNAESVPTGNVEWTFKGKGQFPVLWSTLQGIPFEGKSRLQPTIRRLKERSSGGVVLLISDLLEEDQLRESLGALPGPRWEVSILHTLHPFELAPEQMGQVELIDSETGQRVGYDVDAPALESYKRHLDRWLRSIELTCIQNARIYTQISTGWSLEREIVPHLLKLGILEPI